jgi:hypothetical protein
MQKSFASSGIVVENNFFTVSPTFTFKTKATICWMYGSVLGAMEMALITFIGFATTGLLLPVLVAEMEELVVVPAATAAEKEELVTVTNDLETLEMVAIVAVVVVTRLIEIIIIWTCAPYSTGALPCGCICWHL